MSSEKRKSGRAARSDKGGPGGHGAGPSKLRPGAAESTEVPAQPPSAPPAPAAAPGPARLDFSGLSEWEKTSLMIHHAREGRDGGPEPLAIRLNALYPGIKLNRLSFTSSIMQAAFEGRLDYDAPEDVLAARKIEKAMRLREAVVVRTACGEDVARRGGQMLLKLVQNLAGSGKEEVHIGLAGGYTTRHLARSFAQLLRRRHDDLPRRLVIHTMVAGFDVRDPMTDPGVFCSYFADDPLIQVDVEFVILHASATVWGKEYDREKDLPGIREVYEEAGKLHVIVTSAAQWDDEHSTLARYYQRSPKSYQRLRDLGCIGDILWRPLGPRGPIDDRDLEIRAMTLMDLEAFPDFIGRGGHVLLALGPCHACHSPRPRILESLQACPDRLITHLVVDSIASAAFQPRPA